MSINCMTRVWKKSKAKGSGLLLLLAIADHADDNGFAFPGIPTLANKIRMSERQTIRIIKHQEEAKELIVVRRPNKSNLYVVTTDPSAKRLKAAAARVASFSGYDILSLCKNVMPDMTSEAEKEQKCHAGGDIAVSPDPSLNIIEPSSNHQSDSPLPENSPSPPKTSERLKEKFGADPLEAMFIAATEQPNNTDRPVGWQHTADDTFAVCQRVADLWCLGIMPSGTNGDRVEKWGAGAAELLRFHQGNCSATLETLMRYHDHYENEGLSFTVAGPQSLVGSLPSFMAAGKKPIPKKPHRGAGRPVGRWTETEIETARQASLDEPVLDPATFFDE